MKKWEVSKTKLSNCLLPCTTCHLSSFSICVSYFLPFLTLRKTCSFSLKPTDYGVYLHLGWSRRSNSLIQALLLGFILFIWREAKWKKNSGGFFYRLKMFISGLLLSKFEDTIKDWQEGVGGFKEILRGLWKWVLSTVERDDLKIKSEESSVQFISVTQSCLALCDPMDCSLPGVLWFMGSQSQIWLSEWTELDCSMTGFPVHHQLPELTQTHVHWVSDAIQPSHSLSSPSLPAFNLPQHQGLSQWVSSLYQVAKVLELQLQHQSSQWIFSVDFL